MPEPIFQEFDRINGEINKMITEYIQRKKLLDPSNSKESYQKRLTEFDKSNPLSDVNLLQLTIAFQQMKNLILSLKDKIAQLEAESLVVRNQPDPNVNRIREIDDNINTAKSLLQTALNRFSAFCTSHFQDNLVMGHVAKFKAYALESSILERTTGSVRPLIRDYSGEAPGMIGLYKDYQQKIGSVDHNVHGLAKYRDYITFMLSKDSDKVSNRSKIRAFENAYKNDLVLANPNYKKGKNTLLDMSRYDAYMSIDRDLPIQEYEINDFAKKLNSRDNGHGKDHDDSELNK